MKEYVAVTFKNSNYFAVRTGGLAYSFSYHHSKNDEAAFKPSTRGISIHQKPRVVLAGWTRAP
jgi:hypothetical protein